MNKEEYFEISRKRRTPPRCPFVGHCQRWMYSTFFSNFSDIRDLNRDPVAVLRVHDELPENYETDHIPCEIDPPQITRGEDYIGFFDFCPEVSLFQSTGIQRVEEKSALSSLRWDKESGILHKEYKHFSECLEFIRNQNQEKRRPRSGPSPKQRFEVLRNDNFRCSYCGRGPSDGIKLHVDHKTSLFDGGSNENSNLTTSCDECNFGKGKKSI